MGRRLLWVAAVSAYLFTIKLIYLSYGKVIDASSENATNKAASSGNSKANGPGTDNIDPQYIHHDTLLMVFLFQFSLIFIYPIIQVYYFIKFHISPTNQLLLCLSFHNVDNSKDDNVYDFDAEDSEEDSTNKVIGLRMSSGHEENIEMVNQNKDYKLANENNETTTTVPTHGRLSGVISRTRSFSINNSINNDLAAQGLKPTWVNIKRVLNNLQIVKTTVLSSLLCVAALSFFKSITMLPLLDVTIMSNLSIFEICSLLFTCFGILSKTPTRSIKQTMVDFFGMCVSCIAVLLVTWLRTGTILSSTVTTNTDPFIFNRLAGCLICGLGCLTVGPAMVIWFKYLYPRIIYLSKRESSLISLENLPSHCMRKVWQTSLLSFQCSLIGVINFIILGTCLIFRSQDSAAAAAAAEAAAASLDETHTAVITQYVDMNLIFAGTVGVTSLIFAFIQLTLRETTGFITTICLGNMLFAPLVQYIFKDSDFVAYTSGELKGYVFLFFGLLWLSCFSYYYKK